MRHVTREAGDRRSGCLAERVTGGAGRVDVLAELGVGFQAVEQELVYWGDPVAVGVG